MILYARITAAKMVVTALATVTGRLLVSMPNASQSVVPHVKMEYMYSEISDVFFVFMVFSACGKKEMVVHAAAAKPRIVAVSIMCCVYVLQM